MKNYMHNISMLLQAVALMLETLTVFSNCLKNNMQSKFSIVYINIISEWN